MPILPLLLLLGTLYIITQIYQTLIHTPLHHIPGPTLFALTKWRLAYQDLRGTRTRYVNQLHEKYGAVVRIGPAEVSFNSLSALRAIYGAGTAFQRDAFYRMFDVYGRRVMFSFAGGVEHRDRKKLLNHAFSKTSILSAGNIALVEEKVSQFMSLIKNEATTEGAMEIFTALHYFSLDTITAFLYGRSSAGATSALESISSQHRSLLDDILDPARRRLSWFTIHCPALTNWLYAQNGLLGSILESLHLLPMQKPATYSGIRTHALNAIESLNKIPAETLDANDSIAGRLLFAARKTDSQLDYIDVAAECADHLLAGIDTTSDTLMWAIYALSQPEHRIFQDNLRAEISSLDEGCITPEGIVNATAADKLPYFDAVIKETLRLFAPLPGTEPRWSGRDEIIDGFRIPARTVVTMSPYTLHRNPEVFTDPGKFNPDRWLGRPEDVAEMKRWFWAFSSGGRMCIGMHLAMAEMTTLLASVYRVYTTDIMSGFEGVSPGVTARYEVFSDERFTRVEEHVCWVRFTEG
ncbi:cytochrome P450 [Aspergillus californicus]